MLYRDSLVQKRCNSNVQALELHFFCANPLMKIMVVVMVRQLLLSLAGHGGSFNANDSDDNGGCILFFAKLFFSQLYGWFPLIFMKKIFLDDQ